MALIIAAVCITAGIGIFMVMKKKKRTTDTDTAPKPPPQPETSPEAEYKAIVDRLLALNILMRKDPAMKDAMVTEIEAIIDDLMVVTPSMMERYPSETLTYEIKKIGRQHLYRTVKEYLDLSEESREHQYDMFKKTIQSLHQVSDRSRDIVEKNETAEFKTMANFLAGKFA
ncbi:MAG TPA: hypothetical protein VJ959_15610 [Desulfotignum sp.]|nr:hypothetical protein [Desulfotignum sp.]